MSFLTLASSQAVFANSNLVDQLRPFIGKWKLTGITSNSAAFEFECQDAYRISSTFVRTNDEGHIEFVFHADALGKNYKEQFVRFVKINEGQHKFGGVSENVVLKGDSLVRSERFFVADELETVKTKYELKIANNNQTLTFCESENEVH